jgi:hypothetical protein
MKHSTPDYISLKEESIELHNLMKKFMEVTDQNGEGSFSLIFQHVEGLTRAQKEVANDVSTMRYIKEIRSVVPSLDDVLLSLQREYDLNGRNQNFSTRSLLLRKLQLQLKVNRHILELLIELTQRIVNHRLSNDSTIPGSRSKDH